MWCGRHGPARGVASGSCAAVHQLGPLLLGGAEPRPAPGLELARDGQEHDDEGVTRRHVLPPTRRHVLPPTRREVLPKGSGMLAQLPQLSVKKKRNPLIFQ